MIRNNIKRIVTSRKLLIDDVAKACGMHRYTLSRIYRNETANISFESLDALCNGLNVTVGELFEHVPNDQMTSDDVEHLKYREESVGKRNAYRYEKKAKKDALDE